MKTSLHRLSGHHPRLQFLRRTSPAPAVQRTPVRENWLVELSTRRPPATESVENLRIPHRQRTATCRCGTVLQPPLLARRIHRLPRILAHARARERNARGGTALQARARRALAVHANHAAGAGAAAIAACVRGARRAAATRPAKARLHGCDLVLAPRRRARLAVAAAGDGLAGGAVDHGIKRHRLGVKPRFFQR